MALQDTQRWFDPAPGESPTGPWISPDDVKNAFEQTYHDLTYTPPPFPTNEFVTADAVADVRNLYGDWDPTKKYPPGAVVRELGYYWVARTTPMVGWRPDTDTSWVKLNLSEMAVDLQNRLMNPPRALLGDPAKFRGPWDPLLFYQRGDVISLGSGAQTTYYVANDVRYRRGSYPDPATSREWTLLSLPDLASRLDVAVTQVMAAVAAIPTGPSGPGKVVTYDEKNNKQPAEGDLLRMGPDGPEWISPRELWDGSKNALAAPVTDLQNRVTLMEKDVATMMTALKANGLVP